MKIKLFLDDERDPHRTVQRPSWRRSAGMSSDVPLRHREYVVVRTVEEALVYIAGHDFPDFISFDHDLGEGRKTGMDLAKAIVEMDLDARCIPDDFRFEVHSANPVGRTNIQSLLDNYLGFRDAETPSP